MAQRRHIVPETDASWEEQRERDEKEKRLAVIREERRQNRLEEAYTAVAATESGRVVLADLVNDRLITAPYKAFAGNSRDAYGMGRADFAAKAREYLREILDRETFIEIIEPKKEEE